MRTGWRLWWLGEERDFSFSAETKEQLPSKLLAADEDTCGGTGLSSQPSARSSTMPPSRFHMSARYLQFSHAGEGSPGTRPEDSEAYKTRLLCRSGELDKPTTGLAYGHTQANVVILPSKYADAFEQFCTRNPQGCPILERLDPGAKSRLCHDLDMRSDLPKYRVYHNGQLAREAADVSSLWREDFVSFLLGCSFSWEDLLDKLGLTPRQIAEGKNVPMYRVKTATRRQNNPDDKKLFSGDMVVSMRPYKLEEIDSVVQCTRRFPDAHGAPVWIGNAAELGIADLAKPDFGDAVSVLQDEGDIPVFWACGVTAIEGAASCPEIDVVITHAPGHMLVLDLRNEDIML